MRNLKKVLALALVFAMAFTFTASAASFTDAAEIGASYVDDVNMLVELGVIAGYPDGSFGPQKNITRAEFAKMAYTLKYGSDADGNLFAAQASKFTDVQGNANVAWAKGYINYCANQNIVSGKGNNKFDPQGNITVAEATKMILVIQGCNPDKEGFVGANWQANVVAKAIDLGIYDGWAGDPTVLATRELVAKLMRNAIFSPVYEYSAISGVGSQLNALGTDYNQTLGEKTMGLKTVEGIVVANERYALATNEEGEDILSHDDWAGSWDGTATGIDSEESVVLYEGKDSDGNVSLYTITIDRAVADELIGNKVNVFFKADVSSSSEYNYKNVEVLGDVLVHSETVAYDVPAIAVDVYPDGDSSSETEVLPYIAFEVDGAQKQIKADKTVAGKLAKKDDAQLEPAVIEAFAKYAYITDAQRADDDADLAYCYEGDTVTGNILDDMGLPTLSKYRFISVDGGKTFSYIIKTVTDDQIGTNATYGSVTNFSESKGTITLTGIGTKDLDECTLKGEIATDDAVVFYYEGGKLAIEKAEVVTGAVESYNDEGGVVINGNTYYAWLGNEIYDDYADLFDYYSNNKNAQSNATYYVYNNLIMQIEADEVVAAVENYAVILRAYYDADMDTAYVKLGFGDNTEGTYKIGKYYLKKASEPNHDSNDKAQDFANNNYFGCVVKYNIRQDGSVDLSGQYFKDIDAQQSLINYSADAAGTSIFEQQLTSWNGNTYYAFNDAALVFALYGNPCYTEGGTVNPAADGYAPVKSKVYKLNELKSVEAGDIANVCVDGAPSPVTTTVASYVLNTKTGNNKYVVAASMTLGATITGISYKESRALAYVVSAMQRYNNATDKYYAEFTLINEDGLFTAKTVEDVTDLNANSALADSYIGSLSNNKDGIDDNNDDKYPAGSFLRYDINAEGVLTAIDNSGLLKSDVKTALTLTSGVIDNGLYIVNVTGERSGVLSFLEADADIPNPKEATGIKTAKFHEDGYSVIGIDDDSFVGELITKIPARQEDQIDAGDGNAIIEIDEGQIVRIFSFVDGVSVN